MSEAFFREHGPAGGVDRAIKLSTAGAVLAVAGIAAYISYWHAYAVVREFGESGQLTRRARAARFRGRARPVGRARRRGPRVAVPGGLAAEQLAEPVFPAELVEAGGDHGGGLLVGGAEELGVVLQGGGALGVAEAAGDGVEVDAGCEELGGGVVPGFLQGALDADAVGIAAVPVG